MDLPQTQVKPREIGLFVNNLKRLLIKSKKNEGFCEPSVNKGLAKVGVFIQIKPIQDFLNFHFPFSR